MNVLAQGSQISVDRIVAIVGAAATIVCAVVAILQYRYTKFPSRGGPKDKHPFNSSTATRASPSDYGFLMPLFANLIMSSAAFLVSAFILVPRGSFVSWLIFGPLSVYSLFVLIILGFSFFVNYEEAAPFYLAGLALAISFLILNLYFAGAF